MKLTAKRQSLLGREPGEGVPEATQLGRSGVWDENGCRKVGAEVIVAVKRQKGNSC
jgi:hypothetical protein